MSKRDFCCVGDFPMLIPYRDLQKLLEIARNQNRYELNLSHCNKQVTALRSQLMELAEKLHELEKMM